MYTAVLAFLLGVVVGIPIGVGIYAMIKGGF